jgi:hypothetical protein
MIQQSEKKFTVHELMPVKETRINRAPGRRDIRKVSKESEILTFFPGKKPYTLLFDGDSLPSGITIVQVMHMSSVDEAIRYIFLLGQSCEIYLSPGFRRENPLVYAAVTSFCRSFPGDESLPDIDIISGMLKRIPLDIITLLNSQIALTEQDVLPDPLEKHFVHKARSENVLVSRVHREDPFMYFNLFSESPEIRFDHESEHLQGMLILEALRQVSTATVHLAHNGLPLNGKIALLHYQADFFTYLSKKAPAVIRTYNTFSLCDGEKDKEGYVVGQIFQWGRLCVQTVLKGKSIRDEERFQQLNRFTEKVCMRNKAQFDEKISLFRNKAYHI